VCKVLLALNPKLLPCDNPVIRGPIREPGGSKEFKRNLSVRGQHAAELVSQVSGLDVGIAQWVAAPQIADAIEATVSDDNCSDLIAVTRARSDLSAEAGSGIIAISPRGFRRTAASWCNSHGVLFGSTRARSPDTAIAVRRW